MEKTLNEKKKSKLFTWFATFGIAVLSAGLAFAVNGIQKYQKTSAYIKEDNGNLVFTQDNSDLDLLYDFVLSYGTSVNNVPQFDISGSILVDDNDAVYDVDFLAINDTNYFEFNLSSGYIIFTRGDNFWSLDEDGTLDGATYPIELVVSPSDNGYYQLLNYVQSQVPTLDNETQLDILETIVSLLTGGIVGFSGGIGTGVNSLVENIFITNNSLSVFAGVLIVFCGISLAIGLCRWVMNFLTSLGAKK